MIHMTRKKLRRDSKHTMQAALISVVIAYLGHVDIRIAFGLIGVFAVGNFLSIVAEEDEIIQQERRDQRR